MAARDRPAMSDKNPARHADLELWTDLLEKDDRTSPDEYPDMALITQDEFLYCLKAARDAATARHEDDLAQIVAAYYRREIGRLMHQAEHWANNNKPLAVHDRARSADNYFQIVVLMERDVSKGWKRPFDEMRDSLARPANPEHVGAYPPSAEISAYRDPRHAVAQLTAAEKAKQIGPATSDDANPCPHGFHPRACSECSY